jgi:hypothetical protein
VKSARHPSLAKAMAYRYDQILHKFTEGWDVSFEDAADLFEETKRLLWVMQLSSARGHTFYITPALTIIDQMWHTFVLFTREYDAYCHAVYGRFIHHHPTTRDDDLRMKAEQAKDPVAFRAKWNAIELRQWELVQEAFGESALLKWYVEYPMRFDAAFFRSHQTPLDVTYVPPAALVERVRRQQREREPKSAPRRKKKARA